MKRMISLLAVLALGMLAGCQPSVTNETPTQPTNSVSNSPAAESTTEADIIARGIAVYQENLCATCHALSIIGATSGLAPTHDNMGAIAAERIADPDYRGAATTPAEYLYESIVDPRAYIVEGYARSLHPMPVFAHLPEADIDALVAMLLAQ